MLPMKVLDLTDLRKTLTYDDVFKVLEKAHDNPSWVTAVCLPRQWCALARKNLNPSVRVASVYNFPDGDTLVENVVRNINDDYGTVDEFDVVIPLEQPNFSETSSFIRQIRRATQHKTLKIILETAIQSMRDIDLLTQIGVDCGVDFIKTSTGHREGACIRDVSIVLNRLRTYHYDTTGIKISGGIKTVKQFEDFCSIANIFDVAPGKLRIGASALLEPLVEYYGFQAI